MSAGSPACLPGDFSTATPFCAAMTPRLPASPSPHPGPGSLLVGLEGVRAVKLCDVALVQHHHSVGVHDGVEPGGDGNDGALRELLPDCSYVL